MKLDPKALGSQGYKVNRSQIIGKVDVTSRYNPSLKDQTNREGLRDNEEHRLLVALLQHLLGRFKAFLDQVDKEVEAKEPVSFEDLQERFDNEGERIEKSIQFITQNYPEIEKETDVVTVMREAAGTIRVIMDEANQLAGEYEKGRTEVLHLAGLGLMVEFISHELSRATQHTLSTLSEADRKELPDDVKSLFVPLRSQLKTLEKRLRILDPLSTVGRQRKEVFDLIGLTNDILKSHEAQFQRQKIKVALLVEPDSKHRELKVKAVVGMIVQILENLISNSVYWLKAQQKLDKTFSPRIKIVIDTKSKQIRFTDNGPGVKPDRKEDIFQPFVTTKPPGEGKGLGLYISKEIAAYNGAAIYLSDKHVIHPDKLNTFVLDLEAKGK